ncbi:MAG: hypothetical protein IJJ28_05660, partial [Lentisphaeria bacterium]|nr:hypothetical protein [Lentisphaeria bacterium]
TLEVYNYGVIRDLTFNRGGYGAIYSGATISGGTLNQGGTFSVRGGTVENATIDGGEAAFQATGGTITGAKVVAGTIAAANGTVLDTDITGKGSMTVYGTAKNVTGVTVSKGGTLIVGGTGKANGVTAGEGANILVDLSGKTATAANFDTLANIDKVTIAGVQSPAAGEYLLADVGRDDFKVGVVGSGVFEGEVAAGGSYTNPFIQRGFALSADGRTLTVGTASRTAVTEAATFATSGSVINGGDKEMMWKGVTVAGAVDLIDADTATAITGDAWLDIAAAQAGTGAAIYGTAKNVDFAGKVNYQIHGAGTIGNLAAGANYGGGVAGVNILSYNNTYTGVGYAGGFGAVDGEVEVLFAGGNTLNKDFYAGALANYNKTGLTTGVGSVKAQIGEKTTDKITVKGNFYGASAVKAGTISTTAATTPLHTVGDVSVTLLAGTAADSKFCLFAGGYATGTDSAKLAAVYTVESVNATVEGGSWGSANGGRGIFGGIFASGVKAAAGNVTITVSGGTMGNVYGGGWSQKEGVSVVGDVELAITGGTMANVFGGGTHSTSGGATEAGNVTITVSGGTISGNIYARGQLADDTVANSTVIFTGAKDFGCGVYGYSYVGGSDESNAELGFSDYSGTFSGAIGGFKNITLGGDTTMTLTADAESVSNTAWVFDTAERYTAFAHTALLDWSAADFTGDTIAINLATGSTAEWDLVSAAATTVYNKFDVLVDGTSILSETLDLDDAIVGGAYDGWGFTVENDTLKFAKLA